MADRTSIEWTDTTWNPITGCSVVSAGCKHCYAMKLAGTRLKHEPSREGLTIDTAAGPVWNGQVRFNDQWLDQPMRWRRPRRIFVCAHGDLFHESVPDEWICAVFAIMAASPQHTFQVLTKRPARALTWFERMRDGNTAQGYLHECLKGRMGYHHPRRPAINLDQWPLPNVWLGVSVEDQKTADERIPMLLQCPAVVRWISAEPLLGSVDLTRVCDRSKQRALWINAVQAKDANPAHESLVATFGEDYPYARLDWVVVGGESGSGARPMHPDWARALRDQCGAAGVPFLFKQWGQWEPATLEAGGDFGGDLRRGTVRHLHAPGNPEGHFRAGDAYVRSVGKKAAGRHLDGELHDGYPA